MKRLTFYIILFFPFLAMGQEKEGVVVFTDTSKIIDIGRQVFFLEDKEGNLGIEDILKPEFQKQFVISGLDTPNFNTTRSTIWVKLIVANQTKEAIYLEVAQALAWYINFYKPDAEGRPVLATQTGMMRPFGNREVDNNFFLFELAPIPQAQTYYFSIKSDFALTIPLSLASKQTQMEKSNFYNWFLGGFSGLAFIMLLYNVFIAYSTKDKHYLYYCLYLLGVLFITNFLSGNFAYKLNPMTYFSQYFFVFISLNIITINTFVTSILNLSKKTTLYYVLIFCNILYLIFGGINIFKGHYVAIFDFAQGVTLLTNIYIFLYSSWLYYRGNENARFVVFGFSFWILGVTVFFLQNFGLIVTNFFTSNATVFGCSLEILFFSLALGNRINIMRKEQEASQKALLIKTLENEKILAEQNTILEQNVQERTQELQTLNEELNSNVEELSLTLEVLEEQKKTIEFINNKITSSITYAQTIQGAILPHEEYLQTHLRDYFLIYRPKDVVSGDFYWVRPLKDGLIVAVADCTGHGVAGSFMSLIGINLLDSIEAEMEHLTPAQIIGKLNDSIEKALKQHERQAFNEGMDIGICKITYTKSEKVTIEFSGAKRPLYYSVKHESQMMSLVGDRKSVGSGISPPYEFQNHGITLAKGDMVYLCSDGFEDQNNPERKKFGEKRLKNILSEISRKNVQEQREVLILQLEAHQLSAEQRDDITLMGIRL